LEKGKAIIKRQMDLNQNQPNQIVDKENKLLLWITKGLFIWTTALLTLEVVLIIKHLIQNGLN
jgi:hypothetical protein